MVFTTDDKRSVEKLLDVMDVGPGELALLMDCLKVSGPVSVDESLYAVGALFSSVNGSLWWVAHLWIAWVRVVVYCC